MRIDMYMVYNSDGEIKVVDEIEYELAINSDEWFSTPSVKKQPSEINQKKKKFQSKE